MGGNTSRPEQPSNVERGNVDMNHRSPRDDRDDTMPSYRSRADSSPRSVPRHQSETHRGEPSPRYGREQVWFSADTYRPSPRSPVRARSPPNMRHSFRPERRKASPAYDSYKPRPRPRRPDPDDYHLEYPRRPSPSRRSSAFSKGQSSPVMNSNSPNIEDKDPRKRKVIVNPTWTKPTASSSTQAPAKVEYNGVKDVPSGPAKPSHPPDAHTPVPEHVKRSPHIFISSQHLPALTTTIVHLKGYLRQHQPIAVHIDDSGYYLQYPNTAHGRLTLRKCMETYDGKHLFTMYTLVMEAFADGQPIKRSVPGNTTPSFPSVIAPADVQKDEDRTTIPSVGHEVQADGQVASLEDTAIKQTATIHQARKTTDPRLRNRAGQVSMSDPAQPEPPFEALEDDAFLAVSRSSPPRGTARQSHDDAASSISGRTSEVSASGKTCHVCKQRSELDNLARCSTCPRRYHRYCHTKMPLPATLGSAWQCQRCFEKNVRPKRPLNDVTSEDVASVSNTSGPPVAKKTKLDTAALESTPTGHGNATAADQTIAPTTVSSGHPAETSTGLNDVDNNYFGEIIAKSIGKHVGKDDFIIPSDKSAEALGAQYSMQLAKALNLHPSLDKSLRRRMSDVIISRLATDRTVVKELISGKSNIDMLIASSCTPAEGKNISNAPHAAAEPQLADSIGSSHAEDTRMGEPSNTSTDYVTPAPVTSQRQIATEQAPPHEDPSAPPTEADDLVEQAFASNNATDRTIASNAPKRPSQLNLVRRKAKVGSSKDASSHASHEGPDRSEKHEWTICPDGRGVSKNVTQSPSETPVVDTEQQSPDSIASPDGRFDAGTEMTDQEITAADQVSSKRDSTTSMLSAPDSSKRMTAKYTKQPPVDCAGCGKVKVPRAPLGRVLCIKCKRKNGVSVTQTAAVAEPSAKAGPSTEKASQPSSITRSEQPANNTTVPVSVTADHAGPLTPLLDDDNGKNGQVPSEAACKDCRRRHKRCDHRSKAPATTCQDCRKRHIRCEHGTADDDGDDLDFWSTKMPSTCERCGGTHDPMQCPVQSFPATKSSSASDQLFAVTARSQGNGLWAKGGDPNEASAGMQSDKRKAVDSDTHLTNEQTQSPVDAEVETTPRPSQPERIGLKRKSQRRAALDENDLGDSHTRPKGTFSRLIGMALCEAPGNRLDPTSAVTWVEKNIPGYNKSQGTWSNGLKATMIMNSQGKSGIPRASVVMEGTRKLYQMFPHMVDTHERWDHELQRPVVPEGVHQPLDIGAEDDMDDDGMDDEEAALPGPARESAQAKNSKPNSFNPQPRRSPAVPDDEMEVDNVDATPPTAADDGLAGVYDSSEDEPLATQQSRSFVAPTAPMATMKSSVHPDAAIDPTLDGSPYQSFENPIGMQSGLVRVVERTALPRPSRDHKLPDELLLCALIRDELDNQDYCAKSLEDEWPELHPDFQMDKNTKLAEIKARPRRKQMSGKAPSAGNVNDLNDWQSHRPVPFEVLRNDPFPGAHNYEEEDGTKSKRCKTLEDFLGVPDDLEPHILEKELVYRHRNSRVRTVYKTGI